MALPSIALTALLGLSAAPSAQTADLLELVPEEAFVLITLDDIDSLKAAASKSAWFQFVDDEGVRPFIDYALELLEQDADAPLTTEMFEEELGTSWAELEESFSGSCALYLGMVGSDIDSGIFMGATFLLGEEKTGFHDVLDRLTSMMDDELESSTTSYLGVDITEYQVDEDVFLVSESDDLVTCAFGSGPETVLEVVQSIVARYAGEDSSLGFAENELLITARGDAAGDADHLEVFCDLERVWELDESVDLGAEEDVPEEVLEGLRGIRWARMAARLGSGEEFDWTLSVGWPSEGLFGEAADLFVSLPEDLFGLMPRESISAYVWGFDVSGAWDYAFELMSRWDPEGHDEAIAGLAAMEESEGIDVVDDVIAQLSGAFGQFGMEVPASEAAGGLGAMMGGMTGADADLPSVGGAYVVGLKDAQRVEGVIERLLENLGQAPMRSTEEFQGYKVHTLDVGGVAKFTWAFVSDAFVGGMSPTPVRTVLRLTGKDDAPSALENEKFKGTIEANRGASMLSVVDTAQTLRLMLQTLEGTFRMMPFIAMMANDPDLADVPFGPETPWPDVGAVDRHFEGVSFTTFERADDRLILRMATR